MTSLAAQVRDRLAVDLQNASDESAFSQAFIATASRLPERKLDELEPSVTYVTVGPGPRFVSAGDRQGALRDLIVRLSVQRKLNLGTAEADFLACEQLLEEIEQWVHSRRGVTNVAGVVADGLSDLPEAREPYAYELLRDNNVFLGFILPEYTTLQ